MATGPIQLQREHQLAPTYWLPQRRQIPEWWIVDRDLYARLRRMNPRFYLGQVTLAANKTGRMAVTVDPGFTLTMVTGSVTAADPGDGLGSAQGMMFDPARRQRFMRIPVVSPIFLGSVGTGSNAPFILRTPYEWADKEHSVIQLTITNRANANNVVSILFTGRVPE